MLGFLINKFFPYRLTCDICGVETFDGSNICADCKKGVRFNDGATCPVCGRKTKRAEICIECKANAPAYKSAVSPLVYDKNSIILIGMYKNGRAYLKDYFADLIVGKLTDFHDFDLIVSVPMTRRSLIRRGYDQTAKLAVALSAKSGIPYLRGALEKIKKTKVQKGLTRAERTVNIKGCFKCFATKEIKGKTVLLLDDVMTTGATCDEAARTLLKSGATRVFVATVASVPDTSY